MTIDKSIFGLRFGSNEVLSPTLEDLRLFLERPKKQGDRKTHNEDLVRYSELLERYKVFEQRQGLGVTALNFREKIFFGVLGHSHFINPVLKQEVEQFKYQLHTLATLDFKKPSSFVKSAEEEISRLNPKKKEDAVRINRLKGMVEDRKITLETLKKRWTALSMELGDIALYIRDNLVKIEKLCETSIVVLVDLQITRKKENQLIEDIKTEFKEHVRDALHAGGPVTKQYLETVKQEVDQLTSTLSVLLRDDIYALTGLFEAIHDHVQRTAREISIHLDKIGNKKDRNFDENQEVFTQVEGVLVSLVSDFHFELSATKINDDTAHENVLNEKRKVMVEHVFELLKKDRRTRNDRRSVENRRVDQDTANKGPERRTGKERRSQHHRRE